MNVLSPFHPLFASLGFTFLLLSLFSQLLVFCKIDAYGNPTVPGLLSLAGQMKMGRGLLMAVGLLEGDMVEVRLTFISTLVGWLLSAQRVEGWCPALVPGEQNA